MIGWWLTRTWQGFWRPRGTTTSSSSPAMRDTPTGPSNGKRSPTLWSMCGRERASSQDGFQALEALKTRDAIPELIQLHTHPIHDGEKEARHPAVLVARS